MHSAEWKHVQKLYRACAEWDPNKRPNVNDIALIVASNDFDIHCSSGGQTSAICHDEMNAAADTCEEVVNNSRQSNQSQKRFISSVASERNVAENYLVDNASNETLSDSERSKSSEELCDDSRRVCDMNSEYDSLHMNVYCVSDDEDLLRQNCKQRSRYVNNEFNINLWDACHEENVKSVPYDVDGLCKFRITCKQRDMMNVSRDGRRWSRWHSSSRKFYSGVRRIARCKGSYVCQSEFCPYVKLHKGPNKVQFKTEGGEVVCFTCGTKAEEIDCPAVKIWEYERDAVIVMHIGIHTCQLKTKKISRDQLLKVVNENPGVKPSKLVNDEMVKFMTADGFSWEHLEKIAESFTDIKRIHNVRAEARSLANPLGNNYEALALFKKNVMKKTNISFSK
jgi:hypothetical protein